MSRFQLGKKCNMEFKEWLRQQMIRIHYTPMAITIYRVGNTLIRRIRLRNGEVIETRIKDKQ